MSVAMSSLESPRSSVFTFESSVHSCHVLRCLDDQRRRDLLCDITVVAEGRSFRAHRSVLASCSDYFTHRVSSHAPQGLVITLPQEVTVSGFEPLLQFAYTSKLLFSKADVMEIRHCASVLGFRDLDSACFDFLLPKFFSSSTSSFQRKTCCKTRCRTQSPRAELSDIDTNKDVLDDDKGVKKVVSDSPVEQDVGGQPANDETGSESKNPAHPPEANIQSDGQTDYSLQWPKYRKFQQACGKVRLCLEVCVPETNPDSSVVTEEGYPLHFPQSCPPCSSGGGFREGSAVETSGEKNSSLLSQTDQEGEVEEKIGEEGDEGKWDERSSEADEENLEVYETIGEGERASGVDWLSSLLPLMEVSRGRPVNCEESPGSGDGTAGTPPHRCPLEVPGLGKHSPGVVGGGVCVLGGRGHHEGINPAISSQPQTEQEQGGRARRKVERGREHGGSECGEGERRERGREERSSVEREVAEHLAHGLWSELSSPPPLVQDFLPGTEPGNLRSSSPPLDRLNQLDISSSTGDCPFLHGLDRGTKRGTDRGTGKGTDRGTKRGTGLGCEGSSQSEKSPCVSSMTSGDDGDSDCFDTEGDSESCSYSQRVKELPFSVGRIVGLSRNDFQLMLRHQVLTREQLDFVHDVRRRSKNRSAAQRCRKRKLDCIHNLECEIDKLRTEKDQLISERTHLNQMKLNTWHSVSALCQRVCSEAALRPEQLQVLAKYTSPDCPLSALISPTDPPSPGLGGLLQPQDSP
ncbi:transcription regulator protein BACH1b isoform X2 [Coregonus clupeaformis]|uniref:transcription regulator protein BACH1b isoform X2 n=1 Tax=Coregonus clupeaformis TaxID=59861 RepID=UPI001BE063BA|nr:transcription regulator protein BACH1b isoform X2 [Coregonus clupeaformis]